jgi:hypothetical protein
MGYTAAGGSHAAGTGSHVAEDRGGGDADALAREFML